MSPIQFETNSFGILVDSLDTLRTIVALLASHPEIKHLSIEGHTDSAGKQVRNKELSAGRAASVRAFLIEEGVDAERLTSEGFGSSKPLVSNDTAEGRALNRRVELHISRSR
jgi:outer membrane protein OmpA-like peptidoglycan-associated protein